MELLKLMQAVYNPGQLQLPYRAYSKECPTPTPILPPKRWVNVEVCGTAETFLFYVIDSEGNRVNVTQSVYSIPGYIYSVVSTPQYDSSRPIYGLRMAQQIPFCRTVAVYE